MIWYGGSTTSNSSRALAMRTPTIDSHSPWAALSLTQEHQRSIVHLVSRGMYGSAASMLRLMFEGYIRGLWLAYCASNSDLARFKKDFPVKDIHDMVKHVAEVALRCSEVPGRKNQDLGCLTAFTHCGVRQLARYVQYHACLEQGKLTTTRKSSRFWNTRIPWPCIRCSEWPGFGRCGLTEGLCYTCHRLRDKSRTDTEDSLVCRLMRTF